MENVKRLMLPPVGEIHSYFIASDFHSLFLHLPSFKILQEHSKRVPNCGLIILGDFFDLPFMMKKNPDYMKWIKRPDGFDEFFLPKWAEEVKMCNAMLDCLQKCFGKIIYMGGNHCDLRVNEFKSQIPFEYQPHFDIVRALRLGDRAISFLPYGTWLDVGEVALNHGMWHNVNYLKSAHEECGKSVVMAHVHKLKTQAFKKRGKTCHAWSIPCMSTLSPEYTRRRANDWDNGYGLLHVKDDGSFHFNVFVVNDGKLILPNGVEIDGN